MKDSTEGCCPPPPCSLCGRVPELKRNPGIKEGSHLTGWVFRCCKEVRVSHTHDLTRSEAIALFTKANASDQPESTKLFVRRLWCMIRGHRVFAFRAPDEWALRRCEDGYVEADCVDCGKTLKAPYGLAIPGFRLGTFRSSPNKNSYCAVSHPL